MRIKLIAYFLILVFCQHFVNSQDIDLDGEWKVHWCKCIQPNGSYIHGPSDLYNYEKVIKDISMISLITITLSIILIFFGIFLYHKLKHGRNYFRNKCNRSIFSYLDPETHKFRYFWYNLLAFACFF